MKMCYKCKYWYRDSEEYPCNRCVHNSLDKFVPMNNFEHIKSMIPEDFAKWLREDWEKLKSTFTEDSDVMEWFGKQYVPTE